MRKETKERLKRENEPEMVLKRKELRKWSLGVIKHETIYEEMLFSKLKKVFKKKGDIIKQRRTFVEKSIYFIDIYVKSARLAIEVDGGYHFTEEQKKKDTQRSLALATLNIKTIRIRNEDIDSKFDEVVSVIRKRRAEISCGYISNETDYL